MERFNIALGAALILIGVGFCATAEPAEAKSAMGRNILLMSFKDKLERLEFADALACDMARRDILKTFGEKG